MQRLEVSGAVRTLYGSLGVKGLRHAVETWLCTGCKWQFQASVVSPLRKEHRCPLFKELGRPVTWTWRCGGATGLIDVEETKTLELWSLSCPTRIHITIMTELPRRLIVAILIPRSNYEAASVSFRASRHRQVRFRRAMPQDCDRILRAHRCSSDWFSCHTRTVELMCSDGY